MNPWPSQPLHAGGMLACSFAIFARMSRRGSGQIWSGVAAIAAAISSTLVGALYDGPFRVRQIRFGQV